MKEELLLKDMFPYLKDMDAEFIQSVDGMIKCIPVLQKANIHSIYELDQGGIIGGGVATIIRYVDKNFLVFDFSVIEEEDYPPYPTVYRALFHLGYEDDRPRMVIKDRSRLKKLEEEGYDIQRCKEDALLKEEEAEEVLRTYFKKISENLYVYQEDYEDYMNGKYSINDAFFKEDALQAFGIFLEDPEFEEEAEEKPDFTLICCEIEHQAYDTDAVFVEWMDERQEKSLKERCEETALASLEEEENVFGIEPYSIFSYDVLDELLEKMKNWSDLGIGMGSLYYLAKTAPHVLFSMWQKGTWYAYAEERKEAAEKFLEREREAMIKSFCQTEKLTREELLKNTGLMNNLEITLHRRMQECVLWN